MTIIDFSSVLATPVVAAVLVHFNVYVFVVSIVTVVDESMLLPVSKFVPVQVSAFVPFHTIGTVFPFSTLISEEEPLILKSRVMNFTPLPAKLALKVPLEALLVIVILSARLPTVFGLNHRLNVADPPGAILALVIGVAPNSLPVWNDIELIVNVDVPMFDTVTNFVAVVPTFVSENPLAPVTWICALLVTTGHAASSQT